MNVVPTKLPGVLVIEPRVFRDERGYFLETYNLSTYTAGGLSVAFVQDNLSHSIRGVLRGLHYQHPSAQGKLVSVLDGEVFDVAVDIRPDSPTFRQWFGVFLSSENNRQCYVPAGYAHGFVVTSEVAKVHYKCTSLYQPKDEGSVVWDDPDLAIDWPVDTPILSPKDKAAPRLRDVPAARLPRFAAEY
ncbi:MAG: dTDP-4-dehydrorhamnose 3,5-epimerase [Isosphaeraceae bacterium]|nr:dTDP-4-dehydrorhamnose 3,5-epimerase [Isosphaeraceae bacterium]